MTETTVNGFELIDPCSAGVSAAAVLHSHHWRPVVARHSNRDFHRLLFPTGIAFCLLAIAACTLFLLSRSTPHLTGRQHEPDWAWAVGSGRVKVWIAEPGAFAPHDTWTASWYRGLDGQPLRWDFTLPPLSPGGVFVFAIPLWVIAILSATGGMLLVSLGIRNRVDADPGR